MPLNIVEPNLEKVKPELHELYVKDAKSGAYRLDLSDLKTHVEAHVGPVEVELKLTRESERKFLLENGLGEALRHANIRPNYEKLIVANIGDRVAIDTVDGQRVIRILQPDGETPMVGSGPNGLATLGDLASEAAKEFPSAFNGKAGGGQDAPPGTKTLTRTEFNALTPVEQRQRVLIEKCAVVDDPPVAAETRRPPGSVLTRAEFNALTPVDSIEKSSWKNSGSSTDAAAGTVGRKTDASMNIRTQGKSDFMSEKDRAAWVSKHGLDAYNALPVHGILQRVTKKSDFKSERDRAHFVDTHGLAAYRALPDN